MSLLRRAVSIVTWILRRDKIEQGLDDELREYVEMAAAEKMRDGLSRDEALRRARAELGGVEQAKERVRTERHGHLIDEISRDLRHAVRMCIRQPGFTAVVLVTLALGIGANTAIFSLVDALMLRALAVSKPRELSLVDLRGRNALDAGGESLSLPMARALDGERDIFSGAGGFTGMSFDAGPPGSIARVQGSVVTGSFFQTLGLRPASGRLLTRDDDVTGAPLVAVISDSYWRRQFDRRDDAVGGTMPVNGVPVAIVGVTPPGFDGASVGQRADITIAVAALPVVRPAMAGILGPGNSWLRVLVRPVPGLSAAEAARRLNARWPALSPAVILPQWPEPRRREMAESVFVLEPGATGWTFLRQMYDAPLLVLQAVTGVVLLIACANVASLVLARASTRRREIAVRLAIGASRRRIIGQLMIEGGVLSFAGAALGIGVAFVLSRLLLDVISSGPFQIVFDLSPNWRVLAFSAGLATATGVVFGIAPAFQASQTAPSIALTSDDRTSTSRSRLLTSLVILQVALSLVLVGGAGLFVRTLNNLQRVNTGFNAGSVFVVDLERGVGPSPNRLVDAIGRLPGVTSVSVTTHTPLDGSSWSEAIVPAGTPMPEKDNALIIGIGPRFLETLRISLSAGRDIGSGDTSGHQGVAVVNERYAGHYFPHRSPIGQHLVSDLMGQPADLEIVGVVKDTIASGLRRLPPPIVYVSFDQFGGKQSPQLVIRMDAAGASDVEAVRAALQAQLPMMPVALQPLDAQVNGTIVQERMMATLAGGFGALALVLSSVGLYGVLAYSVARRSREIGIRMALGASGAGVIARVLRDGVVLLVAGIALGAPAAWVASRSVSSMLFGVNPADPATIAAAIGLLTAATLVASYAPARRASRVDPLVALRHD
jgi:predicted permease